MDAQIEKNKSENHNVRLSNRKGWDFQILGRIWNAIIFSSPNAIKYYLKTKLSKDNFHHSLYDRIILRLFSELFRSVFSYFQSECGKIRIRIPRKTDTFYELQGKRVNRSTKRKRAVKNMRFLCACCIHDLK